MEKKKPRLCLNEVEELDDSNEQVAHIDLLPDEIFVKIFSYFTQNQLCKIGQVCKRWQILSRCSILWKNVDITFGKQYKDSEDALASVLNILSPCVTSIKLNRPCISGESLNFNRFTINLQRKCPNLQRLILRNISLSDNLETVLFSCIRFLKNLEVLVLHYVRFFPKFHFKPTRVKTISKIKILDLCGSRIWNLDGSILSKMPHLKMLYLADTDISEKYLDFKNDTLFLKQLKVLDIRLTWTGHLLFQTLRNNCHDLVELYMCDTCVKDEDLMFESPEPAFPHLRTICLRRCHVTSFGLVPFLKSCQSLQNVYVDSKVFFSTLECFVGHEQKYLDILEIFDCSRHHNYTDNLWNPPSITESTA